VLKLFIEKTFLADMTTFSIFSTYTTQTVFRLL